ncbi:MAG: thiol peroxidase [Spirochaetales bacterium]|nr:thiol peroxidase [Spirochaetales bacterium]
MTERKTTTMGGNIITLLGQELQVGTRAPDFAARTTELYQVTLDDYRGKRKLVSVSPSLDTTICDLQTRRFNQEAAVLPGIVKVLSMSMDLPFALKRWAQSVTGLSIELLSDYIDASFGLSYGVLIKELRLLNRSVFIIDEADVVRYAEVVSENDNHPNYAAALEALKRLG